MDEFCKRELSYVVADKKKKKAQQDLSFSVSTISSLDFSP